MSTWADRLKERARGIGARRLTLVALILIAGLACIRLLTADPNTPNSSSQVGATPQEPVEFLLLDTNRVDSYLAQLTDGVEEGKTFGTRLTKSAGVGVDQVIKTSAEVKEEEFAEHVVTPTASSRLIALETQLDDKFQNRSALEEYRYFDQRLKKEPDAAMLEDGDLVRFRVNLSAPVYIEPYLAVDHEANASALFPSPSRKPAKRRIVDRRRAKTWKFRKQVGRDPRVVLATDIEQLDPEGVPIGSMRVLLPLHMKQLSEERSLLRTNSKFTVIGKTVRIFKPHPQERDSDEWSGIPDKRNAYVDTPTLHTWLHAIQNAPRELICRSSWNCATEVKKMHKRNARQEKIKKIRWELVKALGHDVRIRRKTGGFLIVPIAIYK